MGDYESWCLHLSFTPHRALVLPAFLYHCHRYLRLVTPVPPSRSSYFRILQLAFTAFTESESLTDSLAWVPWNLQLCVTPWYSRLHYSQILYLLAFLGTGTSCRPTNVGEEITWCGVLRPATQYRKSDLCIPRNETAWPRSQFLHSFLHCHRPFICSAYPNFLYIPFKLSDI